MDYNKYAEETMEFIKLIEADGCRFPGTPEEAAACDKIVAETENRTGLKVRTEEFVFAPNASIGMINYLGWAAMAFLLLFYIPGTTILSLLGYVGILVFTFMQIFRYTSFWDFVFKKEKARNIITEIAPVSGKTEYSIFLGAHYDSSWCWKLAVKNPDTAIIKLIYGVLSVLGMMAFCLVKICLEFGVFEWDVMNTVSIVCYTVPLAFLPGFFWITQFTSQDKTIGSPGAMDNLTGIGINMMLMKHFAQHPEELPENCRLVNVGFAAEEAGLKGSKAYVEAHKNDPDFKNCYVINLDSIADPDHFEAVKGDLWQGTHFDKNLIDLTFQSMRESGIVNPKTIVNPIGGCDSTPFCQQGIPTLTIAAQNPKSTYYYHTCHDKSERFETSTVAKGIEITYRLIQKIGEQRSGGAAKAPVVAEQAPEIPIEELVPADGEIVDEVAKEIAED